MKKEKIILLILSICCILLISTSIISEVNENKRLLDETEDVMYADPETGEETTTDQKPNIDITELVYTRTGKTVTLKLTVEGVIENRGNLQDYANEEVLSIDLVMYSYILTTSEDTYEIIYVNRVCNLSSTGRSENITDFTVIDDALEITFDLLTETETYESIMGLTSDYKISMTDFEMYYDETNDIPLEIINTEDTYEGTVGEEITFYADGTGGMPPYTSWHWELSDG